MLLVQNLVQSKRQGEMVPAIQQFKASAKVQWWDETDMCVSCPWCLKAHHHPFLGDYDHVQTHTAPCSGRRSNGRPREYTVIFPMDYLHGSAGFEIDKENSRFVANGPSVSNSSILDENEVRRRRAIFQEQVQCKREWIEAVEADPDVKDPLVKRVDRAVEQMIHGKATFVQNYLETSAEADIFLHGLLPNRTRGTTTLHLAAGLQYNMMVELLLSQGADVDAVDINGRTPLMEAALWGRLENVESLLSYGAEDSLECILNNRPCRAIDLARPSAENSSLRMESMSGVGAKEDTSARDAMRSMIVSLLESTTSPSPLPQLGGFIFEKSHFKATSFSLTTHYSVPREGKAVAYLVRGGGLPHISAMSGWSHTQNEIIQVDGRCYTEKVMRLCELVGFTPRAWPARDWGVPGKSRASHAEKHLIAYFVHKHVFLPSDVSYNKTDTTLVGKMKLLDIGMTSDEHDATHQEGRLWNLHKTRPKMSQKEAVIIVSSSICEDCREFVARVNEVLGVRIRLMHSCTAIDCEEC